MTPSRTNPDNPHPDDPFPDVPDDPVPHDPAPDEYRPPLGEEGRYRRPCERAGVKTKGPRPSHPTRAGSGRKGEKPPSLPFRSPCMTAAASLPLTVQN